MNTENIKNYRLVCALFLMIISILIFLNISSIKIGELNKNYNIPEVNTNSKSIKEYGYSEIFELLSKVPNININNFDSNGENKKLLKLELEYKGDINSFIRIIEDLKEEDNYVNLENIKIENINNTNQAINFNLFLIKNK